MSASSQNYTTVTVVFSNSPKFTSLTSLSLGAGRRGFRLRDGSTRCEAKIVKFEEIVEQQHHAYYVDSEVRQLVIKYFIWYFRYRITKIIFFIIKERLPTSLY